MSAAAAAVPLSPMVLGKGIVNPVNEKGKADFGVDIGDVLQLQYIDKDPLHGS